MFPVAFAGSFSATNSYFSFTLFAQVVLYSSPSFPSITTSGISVPFISGTLVVVAFPSVFII